MADALDPDARPPRRAAEVGVQEQRLAELKMQAEHAQRRLDLYRARAYGLRPVSESRMRELEREAESAQERLRAARRAGQGHQSGHEARAPLHDR